MMIKEIILGLSLLALASATPTMAQVTIGSGEKPNTGTLLDLKEKADGTSKAGLGMPRVALTKLNPTTPAELSASIGNTGNWDLTEHIGLAVYNTNKQETANRLCPGLHVWTGDKWQPLAPYPDWSATPPTLVGTPVVGITRTPIVDPLKPLGHVDYLEDVRGPLNDGEYNRYAYARFLLDSVKIKTTTNYTGQKPFACGVEITTWTEITETKTTDEGIFMTQNMNTRYFPDNTLINGGVPSATAVATDAQFCYTSSTGAITKTDYWDKSQGLLYNHKAAVNKDVGAVDEGGTAHEVRQGICPTGWHVPSDMEYAALTATLGGNAVAGTPLKSLTRLAGSNANIVGTSASADMGGFNFLLAGNASVGTANFYGYDGYLWSSSSSDDIHAWDWYVGNSNANVYRSNLNRFHLYSVRCKKNNN